MSLDHLVSPRSVAVIGASDDASRIGGRVFSYLKADLGERAIPVNARRPVVQGVPALRAISELTTVPDLAIIAVPADAVVDTLRECAAAGVDTVMIFSGGFGETGGEGAARQAEMALIAREAGIRLVGPNCMGMINLHDGVRPTFMNFQGLDPKAGGAAIVSQSGAMGVQLFEQAHTEGLATSYLCMTGNEVDVTATEVIAHLIERPDVRVVMAVIEGIKNGAALLEVGRRAEGGHQWATSTSPQH